MGLPARAPIWYLVWPNSSGVWCTQCTGKRISWDLKPSQQQDECLSEGPCPDHGVATVPRLGTPCRSFHDNLPLHTLTCASLEMYLIEALLASEMIHNID